MMQRGNPNRLFWSQSGMINCGEHTPFPGTDTWEWGQWSEVPLIAFGEWERAGDAPMECEICHKRDERDR